MPESGIAEYEALRIANEDAVRAYRDLSGFVILIHLQPDGWHVDYRLANPNENGGGPHYVIDLVDGTIKSKKYFQ